MGGGGASSIHRSRFRFQLRTTLPCARARLFLAFPSSPFHAIDLTWRSKAKAGYPTYSTYSKVSKSKAEGKVEVCLDRSKRHQAESVWHLSTCAPTLQRSCYLNPSWYLSWQEKTRFTHLWSWHVVAYNVGNWDIFWRVPHWLWNLSLFPTLQYVWRLS